MLRLTYMERRGRWAVILMMGITTLYGQQPTSWRQKAQELQSTSDNVSPTTRKSRDYYFDSKIGAGYPLDEPKPASANSVGFVHERLGILPEISVKTSNFFAIVSFSDFKVRISESKRNIYTELTLSIERLLKASAGTTQPLSFTVILPGGKLMKNAKELSQGDLASQYTLEPGRRYLVFLNRAPTGEFFFLDKAWELRDGKVCPFSRDDLQRASNGSSVWAGATEQALLAATVDAIARP